MASHVHGAGCGCSEEAKAGGDFVSLYASIDIEKIRIFNAEEPVEG
jgi:hypothetical protein